MPLTAQQTTSQVNIIELNIKCAFFFVQFHIQMFAVELDKFINPEK